MGFGDAEHVPFDEAQEPVVETAPEPVAEAPDVPADPAETVRVRLVSDAQRVRVAGVTVTKDSDAEVPASLAVLAAEHPSVEIAD